MATLDPLAVAQSKRMSAFFRNIQKKARFGLIFGGENGEKSIKNGLRKCVFLEHRVLIVFFRILTILARFWEAPGAPKINKKLKKSCSGRFWNAFGIFDRFWKRFWSDFGRFWMDFGWILGGFLEIFGFLGGRTMIRATKGTSMDGWMDGWMEKT